MGKRKVKTSNKILIDQTDAQLIKENENVTFINWGNLLIKKVNRDSKSGLIQSIDAQQNLENKDFKKTLKVTWLEANSHISSTFVYYDHLIIKPVLGKDDDFKDFYNKDSRMNVEMYTDDALNNLKKGEIIQIQRKGFFICDKQYDESTKSPLILISIPDGSTDLNIFPKKVQEWRRKNQELAKQKTAATTNKSKSNLNANFNQLNEDIKKVGDLIRQLKADKQSKDVNESVKKLLDLKDQFKKATGKDWAPNLGISSSNKENKGNSANVKSKDESEKLNQEIKQCGDVIRDLKAKKADKEIIKHNVDKLLALNQQYKKIEHRIY